MFPVRAAYKQKEDALNIGLNYLTGDPVWYAGPDIIASILLNGGKIPHIERAVRVVPHGTQEGLKPVKLLGEVLVDPATQDFFKHAIEKRKENKKNKLMYKAIKIIANSTAYGCFVELNEQPITEPSSKKRKRKEWVPPALEVFSGDHHHLQSAPKEIEEAGKFYFPPLASLITAGARLLLALAQRCVEDEGGSIIFCDTDSLCVCASEKGEQVRAGYPRLDMDYSPNADESYKQPIQALSCDTVRKISERFVDLNPYSFGGTILPIEDINYVADKDGRATSTLRQLYGYAISAKRYSIFLGENAREIVDGKAHGVGYLKSPTGNSDWTDEFWNQVLRNEMVHFRSGEPEWLDKAAMMKLPVSSPAILGARLKNFCKPYDFVLSPVVRDNKRNIDEQSEKPILITRFTSNPAEWSEATYYNVRTGKPCHITTDESKNKNIVSAEPYRSVLNRYADNSESKFDGPDGKQCTPWTRGVLQRTHVVESGREYCGKEFKRKLTQGEMIDFDGSEPKALSEFKCKIYRNGKVTASPELQERISKLKLSERDIARGTNLHRKPVHLFCTGKQVRQKTAQKIIEFILQKEKEKYG